MDISNGNGGIDSGKLVDYITKQFPLDLASMIEIRAELEARQGALSAVEDANNLRAEADAYAVNRKAETDDNLAKAKEAKATAEALVAELKASNKDFEARVATSEAELAQREKDVATREKKAQANENKIETQFAEIKLANEKLQNGNDALDARIKAFQDSIKNI